MVDFLALADRVEKLAGPDREMNGEICLALGWTFKKMKGDARPYFRKPGETAYYMRHAPPAYTASLDAAMTLVPEGFTWAGGDLSEDNTPWACVTSNESGSDFTSMSAVTVALALTAACLRARASTDKGEA